MALDKNKTKYNTFKELLDTIEPNDYFSCEVFGEEDTQCTFDWDNDFAALNPAAIEEFAPILNLPCEIQPNGNLWVDTSSQKDDELDRMLDKFVCAVAGYCPVNKWNEWFEPKK